MGKSEVCSKRLSVRGLAALLAQVTGRLLKHNLTDESKRKNLEGSQHVIGGPPCPQNHPGQIRLHKLQGLHFLGRPTTLASAALFVSQLTG